MDNEGSALRPGDALPEEGGSEKTPEEKETDREATNAAVAVFSFASRRAVPPKPKDTLSTPKPKGQGMGQGQRRGQGKGRGKAKGGGHGKVAHLNAQNKPAGQQAGKALRRDAVPPINAPNRGPNQRPAQPDVAIKPLAKPAKMRSRHWGIIATFLMLVIVPFLAIVSYQFFVAQPQYHSITGFTVRSQEESGANDLLGGLAQLTGGSTASDNDILYEFIRSQGMVERVNETIDLRAHYSQYWPNDWFFSIWDDATKEDLIWYWNRIVGVSYDQGTGLIEVQLTAFDPDTAVALTQAIVDVSQDQINRLNLAARTEAMQYAMTDLEESLERLKEARQALTAYRTASQIVDPELDIGTRMGVMNSLQQELASALVEYDLLLGQTSPSDPRLRDAEQRIEVIRDRISIERQNISSSSTETGGVEEDYPTLIAEFERLTTDVEFAEQVYFASLQAMEIARDEANRSSRYLATYISPTQPDTSEYPRIFVLSALSLLFLTLAWSIGTLIYYSIRDKS